MKSETQSSQGLLKLSIVIVIAAILNISCMPGGAGTSGPNTIGSPESKPNVPVSKNPGKLNQCLPVEAEDFGIVGGAVLSEKHTLAKSMGLLVTRHKFTAQGKSKEASSMCTATLIDKQVLLTAAHCVIPLGVIGRYGISPKSVRSEFYFINGVQPFCGIGETDGFESLMKELGATRAEFALANENFYDEGSQSVNLQFDLALLRLPFGTQSLAESMALATVRDIQNNKIFISGYGVTSSLGQDDGLLPALRFAETQLADQRLWAELAEEVSPEVKKEIEIEFSQSLENRDTILLSNLAQRKNACSGDSGGPAVVAQGRALLQIGVASRVENFKTERDACSVAVRYINLGKNKIWIEEKFEQIKGLSTKKATDLFVN